MNINKALDKARYPFVRSKEALDLQLCEVRLLEIMSGFISKRSWKILIND